MARKPKKSVEVKAETHEAEEAQAPSEINLASEESTVTNAPEPSAQHSQCGGVLSAARTEQGFTTKDVAKQLRLSNTQIEALEQDNFASLPEPTIVKGFIRNYAKLLKIPAEPLLNAYVQMVPEKEHYSFALNPGINMKITEGGKSHKLRYFLMAVGLFLGVGIWLFYQNYVQKPNPVNPMPEIVEALPEFALPKYERREGSFATQLEIPGQTQEKMANEENKKVDVVADEISVEKPSEVEAVALKEADNVEAVVTSEEVVEPEGVVNDTPPVLGKTRLAFTATQETWLSVVNTSGEEVYNKILYAGDRDVVDIRQPSEIVVGNAHGATLVVDGKSVDLAPYTRINVARVHMNRLR